MGKGRFMIKYPLLALIGLILGLTGIAVKNKITAGYFLMGGTLICGIRATLMGDWIAVILMLFLFICVAIVTRSKKRQEDCIARKIK